jgi:hypothetical protein
MDQSCGPFIGGISVEKLDERTNFAGRIVNSDETWRHI